MIPPDASASEPPSEAAPQAPADLLVIAERAVLHSGETSAAIEIRDGRITAILAVDGPLPKARERIKLAADEVLLPALVDSHVHANDPGRTDWEGLASLTASAAAGGIGTVIDMPLNSSPVTTTEAAVAAKRAACPEPMVDVGMWGGAVPENLAELPAFLASGVFGLKAFMVDSGIDEFQALTSDDQLRQAMVAVAGAGLPLLVHAEDSETVEAAPEADPTKYFGLLAARTPQAEARAIERLGVLARETGARVHVVHVTSAEGLAAVAAARAAGARMTAETCPHYLALCAEELPDGDPAVKCFPPIRERRQQNALWTALGNGSLGMIVSDHSPAPWALKATGDLRTAWGGIASIQLALPVVWTAARVRGFGLPDIVRWMATTPADFVGLPQKGRIAVGADADLMIFAPDDTFVVSGTALHHRHPATPYEGQLLRGVVRNLLVRGIPATAGKPHGAWLSAHPAATPSAPPTASFT